ncbi:MAG: C1 family peptidase [Bacteroidetes bacterium]|nr:C1 family peptidase [Bacteroidota bacterium]MCB0851044.1 C1 family peptidase [Bacteroidota bacterium]
MNKVISFLSFSLFVGLLISGCKQDPPIDPIDPKPDPTETQYFLGWDGEDDLSDIPTSTNFGFGSTTLPTSVDLVSKFPPIGDQGQYGTCVSWAVAYNIKTAINGMSKGLSASDLASTSNQFSPKDLFVAIPDNQKGQDCNGTNFSNALDVMQNRGVARMQTVPYTSLGDCSNANLQSSWTNEANQNKIKYWRKIDASIQSIKQNLSNNIPVILGAKLADNFMSWNSDNVLSSSTSYNNVGQHAYHAMVIAGYDDNKGPNGAFKVINSWGEFWGDKGYIWVDYNYMLNEFCTSSNGEKPLFIAADEEGNVNPPDPNDPDPKTNGVDLAPWIFSDYSTYQFSGYPTERLIDFNIYNIGSEAASPNADWSIYYIYFNAYNANDYGVLFYDNFNTTANPNSFYCPQDYNCVFNYPIASGSSFTQTVWGLESQTRTYYMPQITGYYYLVMIADVDDRFAEQDELNNLFYTTNEPKYFENGYGYRPSGTNSGVQSTGDFEFKNLEKLSFKSLKESKYNTVVSEKNPNAYTQKEVLDFLKREYENGNINHKIDSYIQRNNKSYGN